MPEFQPICKVGDVPEGEGRMFVVSDVLIGVFNIDGEFFAIDNRCPHAGASLAHGMLEGDTVCCRIHHWRFCVRDGKYLDEDKPQFDARTFPLQIVGDDILVEI